MPRRRRDIIPRIEHHVAQRASQGRFILRDDSVKAMLVSMLAHWAQRVGVAVSGFVILDNHFHLSASAPDEDALSTMMARATADLSRWVNIGVRDVGPNWQGPFFAAPMDDAHAVRSLRYIERNPVAAGICGLPWEYHWSSAAYHAGFGPKPSLITSDIRPAGTIPGAWRDFVATSSDDDFARTIEECSSRGTPLASDEWVMRMEQLLGRSLRPPRIGRPRKLIAAA